MSVFIIINEWTDNQNNEGSEVVGAKYFTTEDDAWGALKDIAEACNVSLEQDETNIVLEDHASHLQFEEYYIQELSKEGI